MVADRARAPSVLALVALVAAVATPRVALAQPAAEGAADADTERGRALYLEGIAAFEQSRYAEAADAFRGAYALTRVPAALHSLATALRAQGRHTEAASVTRRLLRDHLDLDPELRSAAEALLAELRERVGTLRLRDVPTDPPPAVELDGSSVAVTRERPIDLEVDPGEHHVRVHTPARIAFEWSGTVEAGARVEIGVVLAAAPAPPEDEPERRGRPTFWIALGVAAVVVVGVGVGVGIALALDDDGPEPDLSLEI